MKVRNAIVALALAFAVLGCPDPSPRLLVSLDAATFNALAGGIDPASRTVSVENGGGGSLTGLTTNVLYSGPASGWLTATLSSTSAPATLTLQAAPITLAPGAYTATVVVRSSRTSDDPVNVTVAFNVAAGGVTTLSSALVSFTSLQGAGAPAPSSIEITNTGAAPLRALSATVSYPNGAPAGWLTAALDVTTAPATLTLQASPGSSAPGHRGATVTVASAYAANGSQSIAVSYDLVAAIADLVVATPDTLILPASIQAGQQLSLPAWSVMNIGTTTSTSVRIGVYLSEDSIFTATDLQLAGIQTNPLAPGSGRGSSAQSVGIPTALAAGQYWVGIVADVFQQTAESDETNNVKRTRLTVTAAPVIAVDPEAVTLEVTAGGGLSPARTLAVTNAGSGTLDQLWVAAISVDWLDATLDRGTAPATLRLQVLIDTLTPGHPYAAQVLIASPVAADPKIVDVTVTVVAGVPDLAIQAPEVLTLDVTTVPAGQTVGIPPWSVINQGTTGASQVRMGVYLSRDTVFAGDDIELVGFYSLNHRRGGVVGMIANQIRIPPETPPGEYWIGIAVDVPNDVAELDETNNSRRVALTVTVPPTIVFTPAAVMLRATVGEASPAGQQLVISNGGGGTLDQLSIASINYGVGTTPGWLTATLDRSTAPAMLTLSAATAGLAPQDYPARVWIASPNAANGGDGINVTLRVRRALAVAPVSIAFEATAGGVNPLPQNVTVTSVGGFPVSSLYAEIIYPAGQPSGWLTATLSETSPPSNLELRASAAGLDPQGGTFTARVQVTGIGTDPKIIDVTFHVTAAAARSPVRNALKPVRSAL